MDFPLVDPGFPQPAREHLTLGRAEGGMAPLLF